jgi:hypothetical protein
MTIVPDTKDWTWVLERPCNECGFDSSVYSREDFGALIRDNATSWIGVLQRDDVRERPNDAKWSDLEYACHVRDVYRIFGERLVLMLEQDNPVFQNWDQDETALSDRYDLQDPLTVSTELVSAASTIADLFESVEGPQWSRGGTRSNGSFFTVQTLGTYGLHDPMHHLWDVAGT